eukprot:1762784-Prymnesium_polylepis.1
MDPSPAVDSACPPQGPHRGPVRRPACARGRRGEGCARIPRPRSCNAITNGGVVLFDGNGA